MGLVEFLTLRGFLTAFSFCFWNGQYAIRKAIQIKWRGNVPIGVYWETDIPAEAQYLGMQPHGTQDWKIQRAYHSLLANYGADRLHFDRTFKYLPGLLLLVPLLQWSFTWTLNSTWELYELVMAFWTSLAVFIAIAPCLSSSYIWRWLLPSVLVTSSEEKASLDVLSRCLVRLLPNNRVPDDLADKYRVGDIDSEGDSVVGQILAADFEVSALYLQIRETRIVFFFAGVILMLATWLPTDFTAFGMASKSTVLFLLIVALFVYEVTQPAPSQLRAEVMDKAAKQSATEYLRDSAGRDYWQNIEKAKIAQQMKAAEDDSPIFHFGESTGILASRRDPFAPSSEGINVTLSQNDLSTHLCALGASGTGKTSAIIRPTVSQWLNHKAGGLLVLDGKGQLAEELQDAPGYTVISPDRCDYNAIEGLYPEEIADACQAIFGGKSKEVSIFDDAARNAILNAAILLHESDSDYTIKAIFRLLDDEEDRETLMREVAEPTPLFARACEYWLIEYSEYSDRVKSSVMVTAKTWLTPVVQNRYLSRWNDCATGERIEDVCNGSLIGLSLPEAKYGKAGNLISMFAMRRIYQAVKLRGDGWRKAGGAQVLMVADEVQNLVGQADLEMVPIARSLGLAMLWSTQNLDGLNSRLGREETQQLLGNFANLIAFSPRTNLSDEFVAKRVGEVWRTVVERFNGFPDSRFSVESFVHSGTAKIMHATPEEPMINRNINFGRMGHVAGSENLLYGSFKMHLLFRKLLRLPMPDHPDIKEPYADVQIKPSKIVSADEIESLLSRQGLALVVFRRAGVIRRDVIATKPMYSFGGNND
ncbi:hypothetical protein GCM10008090_30730 [Arenicella chitinivorans]|uniref:TraD/TraG TraM recognition site domain-containing protein n=1 Tax=Arenicella chitinivorans TaxID=1329800 RepID=A0A918S0R7_9GAMM|nr:TraM recognition domain-containing protein [Arenicella chitinivorans]GHA18920.1 hypothetical protein GCM10008090_30730 [Arenicella chitinivorans]